MGTPLRRYRAEIEETAGLYLRGCLNRETLPVDLNRWQAKPTDRFVRLRIVGDSRNLRGSGYTEARRAFSVPLSRDEAEVYMRCGGSRGARARVRTHATNVYRESVAYDG